MGRLDHLGQGLGVFEDLLGGLVTRTWFRLGFFWLHPLSSAFRRCFLRELPLLVSELLGVGQGARLEGCCRGVLGSRVYLLPLVLVTGVVTIYDYAYV